MSDADQMTQSSLSEEVVMAARATLCRRVAASVLVRMAECRVGYEEIAARLGVDATTIKRRLGILVNGRSSKKSLDHVSDILLAMDAELGFRIVSPEPLP